MAFATNSSARAFSVATSAVLIVKSYMNAAKTQGPIGKRSTVDLPQAGLARSGLRTMRTARIPIYGFSGGSLFSVGSVRPFPISSNMLMRLPVFNRAFVAISIAAVGFQLSRAANAAEAIAAAGDPQLRLFSVPHGGTDAPLTDVAGSWKVSSPETAPSFSAVAWFFGRELRRALKVPVGLIDSSVGGTPAEAWTSRRALESDPELRQIIEQHAQKVKDYDPADAAAKRKQAVQKHKQAVAQAKAAGEPAPKAPRAPTDPSRSSSRPSALYNGMIAPLQPYAIAGAISYQGEANAGRAAQYQKLFPAMIQNWRQAWGQGDFPFLFVQIAPHERVDPGDSRGPVGSWQEAAPPPWWSSRMLGEQRALPSPRGAPYRLAGLPPARSPMARSCGPPCLPESGRQPRFPTSPTSAAASWRKAANLKGSPSRGLTAISSRQRRPSKGTRSSSSSPAVAEARCGSLRLGQSRRT